MELQSCFSAEIVSSDESGVVFKVGENKYHIHLVGEFNVYNALVAISIGKTQNIPEDKIAMGRECKNVRR